MVSFKPLSLFAATAFAAVEPISIHSPGSDLIIADLVNLDNSVKVFTATINNYTGGIPDATPILLAIGGVNAANRKAYYDSMAIANQSVADSLTIVNYVNDTLVKDIPAGVQTLEKKKQLFVDAGLTPVVVSNLELLKYDHESFSAVLASKAALETHPEVAYVVKVIDDSIKGGIADFSS